MISALAPRRPALAASHEAPVPSPAAANLNVLHVELWHWFAFGGLVAVLLFLDLAVFHRHAHTPSLKESAGWSVFWIGLSLAFNALIWWWGWATDGTSEAGVLFLSGYLVEKSLSVDNIFVFVVIFRFFHVPLKYQYNVLFWGILGAVLMRLVFILAGTELIHRFEWMTAVFGVFLVYTAVKLAVHHGEEVDPANNVVLRAARRYFPVSHGDHHVHGQRFLVREDGRWCVTPLLLVLLVVESSDVLFAVDSVPAIIGITHDRFLVFTSNIFAILGLRALYFLLAGVVDRLQFLAYGLAAVLGFVGLKMIAEYWFAPPEGEPLISPWTSLAVITAILTVTVVASLALPSPKDKPTTAD